MMVPGEFVKLCAFFYGPGLGDGAGCVGLAFGDHGVVTGSLVAEAPGQRSGSYCRRKPTPTRWR